MRSTLFKKPTLVLIILLTLVSGILHKNKRWGNNHGWCMNISSDGRGYYAWLPAIFIYHDLNFHFTDSIERNIPDCSTTGGIIQDYRIDFDGMKCNKYYPGASLCQAPFFFLAHGYCLLTGNKYPANGYSKPYFIMMGIGALLFMFLGLFYFEKLMELLNFTRTVRLLTLLFIFLGSNILYYTIDSPGYSHIYSYTLITFFLYQVMFFKKTMDVKHLYLLAFFGGWVLLARPVNITVLLMFPLLMIEKRSELISIIKNNAVALFTSVFLFLSLPVVLMILYKISTGHFLLYSYANEYFTFLKPHLKDFLFSYDNGLFLYIPAVGISAIASLFVLKQNRNFILSSLIVIVVSIYIHSSWWCWWYGTAFGSRTMLDMMSLFGILMAYSLSTPRIILRNVFVFIYSLSCLLTVILYHQMHHGFLSDYPIHDYGDAIKGVFGLK